MLTVDDGTGLWNATASAAITVVINRPPVAVAGANKEVCAGDIVVFDGSGSQDPDGGLLRYSWDFGDGTGADLVNPTKTYTRGGVYPVTLSVEDESGFANDRHTARMVVRVDESPIAVAGPDQMAAPTPRCASTARPRAISTASSTATRGTSATTTSAAARSPCTSIASRATTGSC